MKIHPDIQGDLIGHVTGEKRFNRIIIIFIFLACFSCIAMADDTGSSTADAHEINALISLADSLFVHARTDSAEILADRAAKMTEENFGEYDTLYAKALRIRGLIHSRRADYAIAESLYYRSLAIQENIFGPEHRDIALTLSSLTRLYWAMGRYVEAEPIAKRALAIGENTLGSDDPNFAEILFSLAMIYWYKGDKEEGGRAFFRAQAIWKDTLEPDHPDMGKVWGISAFIQSNKGNEEEAILAYKKALTIFNNTVGSDHPYVGICQNNLAGIYSIQGQYAQAESLYKAAIQTYENGFSPNHPFVASSLRKLGRICHRQGNYTEAENHYLRALRIMEGIFGSGKASTHHLADLYGSMGEYQKATDHYISAWNRRQDYIEYAFSYASEKQKMRYINSFPLVDYSHLTLSLLYDNPDLKYSAFDMVLKSKAIILDALAAEKKIAYCSQNDEIASMIGEITQICSQISTITLAERSGFGPAGYVEYLSHLYRAKDSLESELSLKCSEFKKATADKKLSIEDVARALPEGSLLYEIFQYWPYNFEEVGGRKFGPRRYLGFTLDRSGEIALTDLGSGKHIDSLISECRVKMDGAYRDIIEIGEKKAEQELTVISEQLYELIFAPVEKHLHGKKRLLISPDGNIILLPFEILPCPDGKYILEKYNVSYLTCGRDLLKFKEQTESSSKAFVIADPDFDLSGEYKDEQNNKAMKYPDNLVFAYQPSRGPSDCLNGLFGPLRYTESETESIANILKSKANLDVETYFGKDALETNLKNIVSPPKVLHISTHGYFCEDPDQIDENPLLRSGLILAGANRFLESKEIGARKDDGILTAFEVSGLNLVGTELVALPACKTGIGAVRVGEGVFGLRRAFQHAGALSVVMSLWSIPDKQTRDLMVGFYERWLSGEPKSAALRNAAIKILDNRRKSNGSAHPVFWGGFVLVGDPD